HDKTACFRELVVFFPCDDTFRRSADKLNRVLWRKVQTDQVQSRTIANLAEREGEKIQAYVGKKAERILQEYEFNTAGLVIYQQKERSSIQRSDVTFDQKVVSLMIGELNREQ